MARCGCQGSTCSCRIEGRGAIRVSGGGSATNPFIIEGGSALGVQDSDTLDLTLSGDGSTSSPWLITGRALIDMADIRDLDESGAQPGYVVARKADGSYHLQPAQTAAAGSISVSDGLIGDGSSGAPLTVKIVPNTGLSLGSAGVALDQSVLGSLVDGAVKAGVDSLLLPAPVNKGFPSSDYAIPASVAGSAGDDRSLIANTQITMRNTGKYKLLVRVDQEGWYVLHGNKSDNSTVIYSEPKVVGGTHVSASQVRVESYNSPGAEKNDQAYRDGHSWHIRVLDPGQSITAQGRVWTSSNLTGSVHTAQNPRLRYGSIAICPLGFVQTPGALAGELIFTDIEPPTDNTP